MITKANKNIKGQSESTGEKWRIVGDEVIKGEAGSVTFSEQDIAELPIDTLPDECTAEQAREVIKGFILAEDLTQDEIEAISGLYPTWGVGIPCSVDDIYSWNNTLYKVIQAHISQSDWEPQNVPALFVITYTANVIPDWVQPTGAHDAYQIGGKVRFNGKIYESKINANVTVPDGDIPYNRYWKPIVG